jgi:hypothetical protein
MPFVRGRYHINSIAGEALEAAREAEAALIALEQDAKEIDDNAGGAQEPAGRAALKGPVRRIEIEAASLVPAHSGRGQRGFVARLHREAAAGSGSDSGSSSLSDSDMQSGVARDNSTFRGVQPPQRSSGGYAARPETHVFSDHHDLVNFLRDEFAKDCRQ